MFIHLRLHTEFSVVDSTCRIDEVVKAAAKDGQPALGITDRTVRRDWEKARLLLAEALKK